MRRDRLKASLARRVVESCLRYPYVWWIRPHIRTEIGKQRVRQVAFGWGYAPILVSRFLTLRDRVRILARFLRIDWNVLHAHRPAEIASIFRVLSSRFSKNDEIMVEAGCWQGGSSAKFSILCKVLGLRLHVYDSFLGVHEMGEDEWEHDFSGQYAAAEDVLKETLRKYGEPDVCEIHKGWFRDTLAARPVSFPVRAAYIDCDTAQGTLEVLQGVMPSLVPDGIVFSQDTHLPMVRELLADPDTWHRFGKNPPLIKRPCTKLAVFRFSGDPGERLPATVSFMSTRPNPTRKRYLG